MKKSETSGLNGKEKQLGSLPAVAALRCLSLATVPSAESERPTSSLHCSLDLYSDLYWLPRRGATFWRIYIYSHIDCSTVRFQCFTHSCHSSWLNCLTIFLFHPFSLNLVIFQVKWHFPQSLFSVIRIIFDSWPSYSLSAICAELVNMSRPTHTDTHSIWPSPRWWTSFTRRMLFKLLIRFGHSFTFFCIFMFHS